MLKIRGKEFKVSIYAIVDSQVMLWFNDFIGEETALQIVEAMLEGEVIEFMGRPAKIVGFEYEGGDFPKIRIEIINKGGL